jgi:Na+-translocating ferredoxin:NAD+ oxidoreductase RnfG subunit
MGMIKDIILSVPTPFNMIVLIALIAAISGVVSNIVNQIRKYAVIYKELEFKREMIDRGMDVAEVERLVQSKFSNSLD